MNKRKTKRKVAALVSYLDCSERIKNKVKDIRFSNLDISECFEEHLLCKRARKSRDGKMEESVKFTMVTDKGRDYVKEWLGDNGLGITLIDKSSLKCEFMPIGGEIRQCTFKEKMHCLKGMLSNRYGMSVRNKLTLVCKFLKANFTPFAKVKHLGAS